MPEAEAPQIATPRTAYNVTLDVFSGLPNPRWRVSGEAAAELARRLAALPAATPARVAEPPGLGYRGFLVADAAGGEALRLYRGAVAGGGEARPDPGRELERWLLESAGAEVAPAVREVVRQDLETAP